MNRILIGSILISVVVTMVSSCVVIGPAVRYYLSQKKSNNPTKTSSETTAPPIK